MRELISRKELNIVYFKFDQNLGKHIAWRKGLELFKGRYVITADDDDPVLPHALEVHHNHWLTLEQQPNYNDFWEVRTRCQTPDGKMVGAPLPLPFYDSDYIDVNIIAKNKAEMVASRRLDILKKYANVPPFPYEESCTNLLEGVRWIRAARYFKTRFVPDITRVYIPNANGLCVNKSRSLRASFNALVGYSLMISENRDLLLRYSRKEFFTSAAIIARMLDVTGVSLRPFDMKLRDKLLIHTLRPLTKLLSIFKIIK